MRKLAATALSVLALTATGCGSDDADAPDATPDTSQTDSTSEAPTADPETEESTSAPATSEAPGSLGACSLVTADDISGFGLAVGPGEPGKGQHNDNGLAYTSNNCEWESDDDLELQLQMSTAEDFGGTLVCEPVNYLGQDGTPIKVKGASSASWLASSDPDEVEARLRVCTDTATLNFEFDAPGGTNVDQLQKQARGIAGVAVSALG